MGLRVSKSSLALQFAEQNIENPRHMHVHKFWGSGSQNNTSEILNNTLSEVMGFWFAEQDVGNLKIALSEIMGLWLAEQNVGNLTKRHVDNLSVSDSKNKASEI